MHNYVEFTDLLTYLMFVQYVVCLIFQELGLVITGTLPVFNKTNTGSKVNRSLFHLDSHLLICSINIFIIFMSPPFLILYKFFLCFSRFLIHLNILCMLLSHPSCFHSTD